MLPSIKNAKPLKSPKNSPLKYANRNLHVRNSSVIQRPSNSVLKESEFQMRCEKLWMKFNSRISPVLQKYNKSSFHKQHLFSNDGKMNKISSVLYRDLCLSKKLKKHVKVEVEEIGFGVQCEISSESSEADIKVQVSRYNHLDQLVS